MIWLFLPFLACLNIDKLKMVECDPNRPDYDPEVCQQQNSDSGFDGATDGAASDGEIEPDGTESDLLPDTPDGSDAGCQNQCDPDYPFTCQVDVENYGLCVQSPDNGCFYPENRACGTNFECPLDLNMCISPVFQVNVHEPGLHVIPQIGALNEARMVVAWQSYNQDGAGDGVYARFIDSPGQPVGAEFQINQTTTMTQAEPRIGILDPTRFVVVWQSENQGSLQPQIIGSIFNSLGDRLYSEFSINAPTNNWHQALFVTALTSNRFVVVWERETDPVDLEGARVFFRLFDAIGSPKNAETRIQTSQIIISHSTRIGVLDETRFVLVFEAKIAEVAPHEVYGAIYDSNGATLRTQFSISTDAAHEKSSPEIAVLTASRFVAVWESNGQDGDGWGIFGQVREHQGQPLSSEFSVNQVSTGDQQNPYLLALDSSRFVVAWQQTNLYDTTTAILARIFNSKGEALNSEFIVDFHTTNYLFTPQLIGLGGQGFMIIWQWQSLKHPGSPSSLYGRQWNADGVACTTRFLISSEVNQGEDPLPIGQTGHFRFAIGWAKGESGTMDILGRVYYQE